MSQRASSTRLTSAFAQAEVQLEAANATLVQAESALAQSENELSKKKELSSRGQQLVSKIEIERLENTVAQRKVAFRRHKPMLLALRHKFLMCCPRSVRVRSVSWSKHRLHSIRPLSMQEWMVRSRSSSCSGATM